MSLLNTLLSYSSSPLGDGWWISGKGKLTKSHSSLSQGSRFLPITGSMTEVTHITHSSLKLFTRGTKAWVSPSFVFITLLLILLHRMTTQKCQVQLVSDDIKFEDTKVFHESHAKVTMTNLDKIEYVVSICRNLYERCLTKSMTFIICTLKEEVYNLFSFTGTGRSEKWAFCNETPTVHNQARPLCKCSCIF